jgi:hypothetical protein
VGEPLPDGFTPLLRPAIVSGTTTPSFAEDHVQAVGDRLKADLAALPEEWRSLKPAPSPAFPVRHSRKLAALLAESIARLATASGEKGE